MSEHELWNELGNLYYLSDSFNQAIYSYNRSIQIESRFGKPYSNLAHTFVRQGKYAEAVKLYQTSIELLLENKEKAITWYRLGDVYRCLKNYRDAILAYKQGDLLDPTLNQDSKELGEVLYGPSELTSAPKLSQVIYEVECKPIAGSPSSDFTDVSAPSVDLINPMPDLAIKPEPTAAVEIAPVLEESKADNKPISPILPQEIVKDIPTIEDQSAPPIDDEFFTLLFEQEPFKEEEEEELGDWLYYFEADHPESTVTHTDSSRFSSEGLVVNVPNQDPVSMRQNIVEYPLVMAREGHLETLVRIDFQNIAVAKTETSPLALATATNQDGHTLAAEEEVTTTDIVDQKPVEVMDEAVSNEVETSPLALATATNQDGHTLAAEEEVTTADIVDQKPVEVMDEAVSNEVELEIERIKQVLDADPDNAMAWQTLGDHQKSAKRYKEAIYAYQQSVSKDPKNIDSRHRLGLCYSIEGCVEEAIRTFQEVLKLNPGHGLTHATLGGYYRKMGLKELAEKHLTIAMKNIYNSENEYNRACLQALCGNLDEALSLLRVALETKQTFVDWVLRDPDLDGIRFDPRFKQLISEFA